MINEELILNLVEDTDKILYTFEKDGKFSMSSSIRNELFQEANASLKQVKEALAQPAQEPVAYIRKDQLQKAVQSAMLCEVTSEPRQDRIGIYATPLQRPWVGLTDEEAQWLYDNCRTPSNLIDMVEARLKDKNT